MKALVQAHEPQSSLSGSPGAVLRSKIELACNLLGSIEEEIKRGAFQLPDDEREDLAYDIFRRLEEEGFEIDWEREEVVGRRKEPLPAIHEKH